MTIRELIDSSKRPFVTVVMPVRNEARFISRSLGAVLCQDYPSDRMEVIVVDGMSTDGTREFVESMRADHQAIVQLVDNPRMIAPSALNIALERARGDIIVRVDGHCEIHPDYISRCVSYLEQELAHGVGGPLETIGETPMARVIALAMSSGFGVGGSAFRTTTNKTMLTDTVAFPAYTRSILERAGPFDEELVRNQDDEYNYRLRKLGAKILLAADVQSRYYSRGCLRTLARQYFQYGYWKVRVMQKHPWQMRPRQFVPPLFVVGLMLSLFIARTPVFGTIPLATLMGVYIAANLTASVITGWGQKERLVILLPVVFVILHFAYGFGFVAGLLRFWNRWKEPVKTMAHEHAKASGV